MGQTTGERKCKKSNENKSKHHLQKKYKIQMGENKVGRQNANPQRQKLLKFNIHCGIIPVQVFAKLGKSWNSTNYHSRTFSSVILHFRYFYKRVTTQHFLVNMGNLFLHLSKIHLQSAHFKWLQSESQSAPESFGRDHYLAGDKSLSRLKLIFTKIRNVEEIR